IPDGAWGSDSGYSEKPGDAKDVGGAYHLTEMFHPLESLETMEQILSLPWHDLHDPRWVAPIEDRSREIQREGFVSTMGLECSVFESSWYLRGMETLFMDLIEGNGIGDWLLDRMRDRSMVSARAFARAGGDLIRLGDDVGTQRGMMMSVPFWREHLKPRLAAIIDAAKGGFRNAPFIQYHSDGDVSDIVDDLVEIGVDILNPVQPECMPIDEVAPRWKDRIAFCGMIGTQTTMPFGSPNDVREAVGNCERWIHEGARMIVSPTHVLEPDVPWENVVALAEAVGRIDPSGAASPAARAADPAR
ncbi:MAG TPA: uroporphyrinogen decarboxylase family protein, partial [Fimbriimonas sp.]